MKKIIKSVFNLKTLGIGSVLGFVMLNAACNKDFDNVLPKTFKNDTAGIGTGSKKVLYIILDGVRGAVVRSIAPNNLTQLNSRAIYSYDGLADYQLNPITNAAAWTTMTTGVDYTKHNVTSESFAGLNVQATPTIFTRLKQSLGNVRTVSLASTAAFNDNLAADASVKQSFADDKSVKDAVVNELANNDPSVVVAQFHSAETAGAANGYTETATAYTTAINTLDGYIGEMLTALKARKGYAGENWLVIIAANKGGASVSGGQPGSNIFNDASRNTYLAFYNPRFSPNRVEQPNINSLPYVGSAPRFVSNTSSNGVATLSNTSIGNFGSSGSFTFMFKFRDDYGSANYYPMFIGKRSPFNVSSTGWGVLLGANSAQLDYNGSPRPGFGIDIRDGKWHTVAFKIYLEGTQRKISLFVDGVIRSTNNISGNADNSQPLKIGADKATDGNTSTNLLIKDVALFNIALSDADIISTMRIQLKPSNPFYGNLLGYWPGDETSGTVMADKSGKGNNFTFNSAIQFSPFSDISPNISPEISQAAYLAVPNGVDIPVLIYNWMNIAIPAQWNLMGKAYLPAVNYPTK